MFNLSLVMSLLYLFVGKVCSLSKFVNSSIKFQVQQCKSYFEVTKYFIIKLPSIKILKNSFIVATDVSSLYTKIDHEGGTEACFKKLEERDKNKSISSIVIKDLILMTLNPLEPDAH